MTNQTTPSIYVASLSDYNAGILHGRWIGVYGVEHLEEQITKMLSQSPYAGETGQPAEELAIHDYEGFEGIRLSESHGLEEVCALAEALEEYGAAFAAFWQYDTFSSVESAVKAFEDAYQGTYESLADWAEDYADSTGLLDSIPKSLRYYFDFERWAHDAELNGDVMTLDVSSDVAVFWNNY